MFKLYADNAPTAIVISDETGRVIFVNRKFTQLFGFGLGEMPRVEDWWPRAYPDENLRQQIRRAWEEETTRAREEKIELKPRVFTVNCAGGEERQIEFRFSSTGNLNMVTMADVTELYQADQAFKANARLLKLAGKAALFGGWEVDLKSGICHWSEEVANIHDIPEKLEVTPEEGISFYAPEDRPAISKAFKECAEQGKPYELELQIISAKGIKRWVRTTGRAEVDDQGQVTRVFGIFQDITAIKTAEIEQARLQSQFLQAQKLESIGRLAGGIAHDFNNMLGVILGNLETIIEDLPPEDGILERLHDINKAAEKSALLARQLLAFARKQEASRHVLDINETIEKMLNMLKRLIGENIELRWQPGPDLWKTNLDPGQIDQIIANLVVNSRDAISQSGLIVISTQNFSQTEKGCNETPEMTPGDYIRLQVIDNGAGMDPETLANAFEPFFTTKPKEKGTGLGLSTVYGIVKQNEGFVYLTSKVGSGTTVTIFFPRHCTENKDIHPPEPQASQGGTETILLVEDEPAILKLSAMILRKQGYRVLTAAVPSQALTLATEFPEKIDLLLTDVIMPEMNGRELSLKLFGIRPELKRIYMSGYTADVISGQGIVIEGVHFLQKPFKTQDLLLKIREVLDLKN